MSDVSLTRLIGLGLMGTALAQRLRAAGFRLLGFDVDAAKMQRFAERLGLPAAVIAAMRAQACA